MVGGKNDFSRLLGGLFIGSDVTSHLRRLLPLRATESPADVAIARGVAAGWVHVLVASIVGPVQTYFLLRYLDKSDAGYWLVVFSFTNYLALFDLGIGPTLTRRIAFIQGTADASGRGTQVKHPRFAVLNTQVADLIATVRRLYLCLAAVLVTTALAAGPLILPHVAKRPFTSSVAYAWTLVVLGSATNLVGTVSYSALAGLGVVGVNRFVRATAQLTGLVLSIAALRAGYGVPGIATSWLVQNVLFFLAGGYLLHQFCPELHGLLGIARTTMAREMIGPSLRWAGISVGAAMIFAIGPAIISYDLGPELVPQYVVLYQLFNALYAVSLIPTQASEPFVARAYGAGEHGGVLALLTRNLRHVAIPLVCGSAFLGTFGQEVVTLWVGPGNFAGNLSLWLFVALFVLETHHVVHASVVMATGHIIFLPAAIGAGLLTVGLSLVLVPQLGVVGMVLSMFLAQVVTNNWYAPWYSLRLLGVPLKSYLAALAPLGWFALGTAAAAIACKTTLLALGVAEPRVVAGAGLFATLLVGMSLAWKLALKPAERDLVVVKVRHLRRLSG